jgi:hypothetical protein
MNTRNHRATTLVDSGNQQNTQTTQSFDLNIFLAYLADETIERIAEARNLAPGTVELRIKFAKDILNNSMDSVPRDILRDPKKYKTYWRNLIQDYMWEMQMNERGSEEKRFLKHYRTLPQSERLRVIQKLEQELNSK